MKLFVAALALVIAVPAPALAAKEGKKEAKVETQRAKVDAASQEALDRIVGASPEAKALLAKSAGWAAFNNLRVSLGLTGGGGNGVAVDTGAGTRTYMKMGTGGVNVGLGAQKYQVLFLFENQASLDRFIEQGWQADASASASAGKAGANAETTFRDGVAVFQMTEKGLMLQADISGTKYWKNDKLN